MYGLPFNSTVPEAAEVVEAVVVDISNDETTSALLTATGLEAVDMEASAKPVLGGATTSTAL